MQEVRIKDLYLCAFILNENQYLLRTEDDNGKFWFIFEDTVGLNDLIKSYRDDTALTHVKSYVSKISDLKDVIFSQK